MSDLGRVAVHAEALPEVSVVVPVYNSEHSIRECLDSLLALDYPTKKLEIVVVDNGSADGTLRILDGYGSRIRTTSEALRGPGPARNRGVELATGEMIAFTDADCTVDRRWLRHLLPPLAERRVGIVGGRILAKRPCNDIEMFGELIHDHQKAIEVSKPPYVITMNWASRRTTLKEIGLFDPRFVRCEDVDLSRRILQAGYAFRYEAEAVIYHRNERSLGGLFREGYQHGFWSVQSRKVQRRFLAQFGPRRVDWHGYRRLIASFRTAWTERETRTPFYDGVFNSGKKLGKLAGSVRFLYLDL